MKNKALNTFKYTGIVTLSQYIGSKKVKIAQAHNTGGNPLFDFLANCLVGDFALAEASRPNKIMLVKRTEETSSDGKKSYDYESKSPVIYLLTTPEKVYSATQSIVRYSFLISRDALDAITNFDGLGIGLYTAGYPDSDLMENPENFAAYCDVELSKKGLINAALVVDWELVISNNADNKN